MEPDYTKMDAGDLLNACGDDAEKWARAFMQHTEALTRRGDVVNLAYIVGWFANAMMRAKDEQRWRNEKGENEGQLVGKLRSHLLKKALDELPYNDGASKAALCVDAYARLK